MTKAQVLERTQSLLSGRGGKIVTVTSDTADLADCALELFVLTTGTVSVVGADGVQVDFLQADLDALGGRIPFAVARIRAAGTTATRFLACN